MRGPRRTCQRFSGRNDDLYPVKVKPKDYVILYVTNRSKSATSLMANLLVWDPITHPKFLQGFESVCEGLGPPKKQRVVLGPHNRRENFRDWGHRPQTGLQKRAKEKMKTPPPNRST
ncbi:hypothetical protein PRBEI_2001414100 [Prionailurus iriomotensis]